MSHKGKQGTILNSDHDYNDGELLPQESNQPPGIAGGLFRQSHPGGNHSGTAAEPAEVTIDTPRTIPVSRSAVDTTTTTASTAPVAADSNDASGEEAALPDAGGSAYQTKIAVLDRDRTKNMAIMDEIPRAVTDQLAAMDNYFVSISDPRTGTIHGAARLAASPAVRWLYGAVRTVYVQIFLAVVFRLSAASIFWQGIGKAGNTNWLCFLVWAVLALEMCLLVLFQGLPCRLALPSGYWRLIELAIFPLGFILEIVAWATYSSNGRRANGKKRSSTGLVVLAWLRLLCAWVPHARTRWEQVQFSVRTLTSAERRRYVAEGYDLDYSYVHRNLAAMGWPAYNYERLFRNSIQDVAAFLDRKHPSAYLVVNLCSERTYSGKYFHQQTSWYPMDDHNPAELEMMLAFSREAADFIAEDPNCRAVVVHCKGGKGRTGTLCCAYMMFTGLKRTADDALWHFAHLRTRPGASSFQGVQAPSQDRYVRYFERLLRLPNLMPPARTMRVTGLRLNSVPWLWYSQNAGRLWFVIITKPCTERRVVFLSNEDVTFSSQVPDPSTYTKKQLKDLFCTDENNLYKECNEVDPAGPVKGDLHNNKDDGKNGGADPKAYALDTSSFWFFPNGDRTRRYSHQDFYAKFGSSIPTTEKEHLDCLSSSGGGTATASSIRSVSLELKDPSRMPVLSGDFVFKFYFARNSPNPLEPPVQFWLHSAFESDATIVLDRDKIDGPPKDKKAKRYPMAFSIELDAQYAELDDEGSADRE